MTPSRGRGLVVPVVDACGGDNVATEEGRAARHLDAFFDLSPGLLCICDSEGRFRRVSTAWETTLGYAMQDLLGEQFLSFVHPDDVGATIAEFEAIQGGRPALAFENRYRCSDGSYRWLQWTAAINEADSLVYAVVRDITRRYERDEELRRAKEAAEEASHAKSDFLSRMSHELRTPLNSIIGFGQLLEMSSLGTDDQDSVRHVLSGGRHLLELIDDVLDIARIEAGRLPLSVEQVSIAQAFSDLEGLVPPIAAASGVSLTVQQPEDEQLQVAADRRRLVQVLLNLASNAVKYNQPGGSVIIAAEAKGDAVVIAVTDTGVGLTDEQQAQLFRPFERLGAEGSGVEGTGLGLALSKALVELMRGSLDLSSEAGVGSTFTVTLPRAEARGQEEPGEVRRAEAVCAVGRVLYIEDNLNNLHLVERGVETRCPGVEIIAAMQGRLGLELAARHRPDLILLDVHLPDIPGGEVLAALRSNPATASTPVVVISADATGSRRHRMLEAGAARYLTKPIDLTEFLEVLEELLPGAVTGA